MSKDPLLQLQKNVSRCIERLSELSSQSSLQQQLPAFCFTGTILDEYLTKQTNHIKTKYYYELFEAQFNKYRIKIIGNSEHQSKFQKNNKQEILKGVTDMLQRHHHLKTESQQSINLQKLMSKNQDLQFFNKQLNKIRKLYADHNIDQTCMTVQALKQKIKGSQNMRQFLTRQLSAQFNGYQQEYEKMLQFYSNFEAADGWVVDKVQQNIRLQYKVFEQSRTIGVRVSADIDIQMLPFMAIACQIDLQKHYMSFVQISQERKSQTYKNPRNIKIGYSLTSIPLLADRQCYFYAIGYDRIKTTGSIFMYTQSFEDNQEIQKKFRYSIESSSEKTFLKVHYFCLDYKPITKNRAQVRFVTKADFKLSYLPLSILTLSSRIFAFNYFQSIVDRAKNFKGSMWQQKVKKNPDMYDFFQEKIDEYFGKI